MNFQWGFLIRVGLCACRGDNTLDCRWRTIWCTAGICFINLIFLCLGWIWHLQTIFMITNIRHMRCQTRKGRIDMNYRVIDKEKYYRSGVWADGQNKSQVSSGWVVRGSGTSACKSMVQNTEYGLWERLHQGNYYRWLQGDVFWYMVSGFAVWKRVKAWSIRVMGIESGRMQLKIAKSWR